jgi:hypothetical protein
MPLHGQEMVKFLTPRKKRKLMSPRLWKRKPGESKSCFSCQKQQTNIKSAGCGSLRRHDGIAIIGDGAGRTNDAILKPS